jgi:hypothetical protein
MSNPWPLIEAGYDDRYVLSSLLGLSRNCRKTRVRFSVAGNTICNLLMTPAPPSSERPRYLLLDSPSDDIHAKGLVQPSLESSAQHIVCWD